MEQSNQRKLYYPPKVNVIVLQRQNILQDVLSSGDINYNETEEKKYIV